MKIGRSPRVLFVLGFSLALFACGNDLFNFWEIRYAERIMSVGWVENQDLNNDSIEPALIEIATVDFSEGNWSVISGTIRDQADIDNYQLLAIPDTGKIEIRTFYFDTADESEVPDWFDLVDSSRWRSQENEIPFYYRESYSGGSEEWLLSNAQKLTLNGSTISLAVRITADDSRISGSYWLCMRSIQ